jgi:hypothetical protein
VLRVHPHPHLPGEGSAALRAPDRRSDRGRYLRSAPAKRRALAPDRTIVVGRRFRERAERSRRAPPSAAASGAAP